jgi:hypothetical protein
MTDAQAAWLRELLDKGLTWRCGIGLREYRKLLQGGLIDVEEKTLAYFITPEGIAALAAHEEKAK